VGVRDRGMMQYIKDGRLRRSRDRRRTLAGIARRANDCGSRVKAMKRRYGSASLAGRAAQGCDREAQHRYRGILKQPDTKASLRKVGTEIVTLAGGFREIPTRRAAEVVERSQGDRPEG